MRRRKIVLRRETVRVLSAPDLARAAGGQPASDEAGICAPTLSWCSYDCQTVRPQLTCWLDP